MLIGLRFQLLELNVGRPPWIDVYVPAVVIEETVGNYARAMKKSANAQRLSQRERRRLGLDLTGPLDDAAYRSYLKERLDSRLGVTVLPWCEVSHAELVHRAVSRTPPFDSNGCGYRDSLVWADVVELARAGRDVVLVSADRAFATPDGSLAPSLCAEVDDLAGTVSLAPELGPWLLAALPWDTGDMSTALVDAQDREVNEFLMTSDIQGDLQPTVPDLGFEQSPYNVIIDAEWDGSLLRARTTVGPDGLAVVEYDLNEVVEVEASFPSIYKPDVPWLAVRSDPPGYVIMQGALRMVLRVAVMFGGDVPFSIDEVGWRRADGMARGADVYRPEWNPGQLRLGEPSLPSEN
jgi:hypothetical protein